ncbi:hypothetical protein B0H14DRAFT_3867431 [Mycena olivaceomarginata]|nr:hypothetical protein B0H14DRAFT_3867431 [Mycena olivaceomarginata]
MAENGMKNDEIAAAINLKMETDVSWPYANFFWNCSTVLALAVINHRFPRGRLSVEVQRLPHPGGNHGKRSTQAICAPTVAATLPSMSTSASASVLRLANPPAQSTSLDADDYELDLLDADVQAFWREALSDDPPPRRIRRWSLPDPTKLPWLVATAHKLHSADDVLPEPPLPPRRRRSMSDFDDLKLHVAHLSHSEFRDAYQLQPEFLSPPITSPRRGVQVTRWRMLNTLFIASFGLYKSVLTYQGDSTTPTTLDWLLGVFWATVSYWVGLLEAEDPALATWLFEEDVWPTVRFRLALTSRLIIAYFGVTFPFMSLVLDHAPEGVEIDPPSDVIATLAIFGMLIYPGLFIISVLSVPSWGPVVAQFIGKMLSKVKRLYLRIKKRGEKSEQSLWMLKIAIAFLFLMFSGIVRFLEKIGAINGPAWWVFRAITGGRSPFARPDHVQTPFQRGWDATVALGQGAAWFFLLTMGGGYLLVWIDFICAEFFPRWWDGEEGHEGNDTVPQAAPTEDLIDLGIQSEAPAETAPQPSPSSAVVLPESRPVVINDVVISNCLVVVNLVNRNVPDDPGLIFVANMLLSATPRIDQIIAALEKDDGENNQFHRKVRKWGLERTVVAFNRTLWSLDDARYDTALAGYTELGSMATLINDENAVVLPVLDGRSPAAERLRLLYGRTAETSPIFQVFFIHLSTRPTFTSPRAGSSSSAPHLPPPISLPTSAVTRNRAGQAHLYSAYLRSTYPAVESAAEAVHELGRFYRRLSRIGVAARLWRSTRQKPVEVNLVEV